MTVYLTVVVLTMFCLMVPTLRLFGVIGVGLLLLMRPAPTLGILFITGLIYFFYRRKFV